MGDALPALAGVGCERRAEVLVVNATDTSWPRPNNRNPAAYLGGGFPRRISNLRVLPPGSIKVCYSSHPPDTTRIPASSCADSELRYHVGLRAARCISRERT